MALYLISMLTKSGDANVIAQVIMNNLLHQTLQMLLAGGDELLMDALVTWSADASVVDQFSTQQRLIPLLKSTVVKYAQTPHAGKTLQVLANTIHHGKIDYVLDGQVAGYILQAIDTVVEEGVDSDTDAKSVARVYRHLIDGQGSRAIVQLHSERMFQVSVPLLKNAERLKQFGQLPVNDVLGGCLRLITMLPDNQKLQLTSLIEQTKLQEFIVQSRRQ